MMQIKFESVNKSFYTLKDETKVLNNINIEIPKGKIVAIVGPSGCGKSTLLNMISGLIIPDSGSLTVDGKIGYMFQKDNLLSWRNVYKNITLGLEIKKEKINEKYIDEVLKKYGLYEFKYSYPHQLSGGMRQRVALIRTLVLNPDILLLDEPFSSLDFQSKIIVQEDIYKIIKESKKTTIMVTHDISEAISMADIIYVLTNRPSTIKKKFDIDLKIDDDKRTPLNSRKSDMFSKYFSLIWKELDFVELNNK